MYRIIIPLDGSELSEGAIEAGVTLAQALDGFIVLAHIADGAPMFERSRLPEPEEDARLAYLKEVAARMPQDIDVALSTSSGDAADEIIRMAGEFPNTIVVMSSHGRGGLGRLVFGSVTDKVMRGATVPVLVVPAGQVPFLRNVLVPLDGSELAEAALPLAVEIAKRRNAILHLVRVVEPFWGNPALAQVGGAAYLSAEQVETYDTETYKEARKYLSRVAAQLDEQGVYARWDVRRAKPVDGIIDAVQATQADMILMSSHGHGGIKRWAFGSVATEIVQRKIVPVMVLPPASLALPGEVIEESA